MSSNPGEEKTTGPAATAKAAAAAEFNGLVEKMQASKSKKAVHALFGSNPTDLGKAAVKAAKANAH